MTSAEGMRLVGIFETYPFRPARRRARIRAASSRVWVPVRVVTNLGIRAALVPSMTARARASWRLSVALSRTKRLRENAHTARHDDGWLAGSQTGSARSAGVLSVLAPDFGVRVSMTCPSL